MTDDEIFETVRRHIGDVLPLVETDAIRIDQSMRELGANSIDRMDVVIGVQDELGIAIPSDHLAGVHDIRSLVDVLREHL
ncbi:phosphopantetheine-binding protein [Salinactinospora qingdaonensis]|uniref:Acyl carrier protein n=1 Tax=Salinactinospora qingdaonensis TaxID=702744 RepID=A0ABP7G3X6_9ACTN